MKSVILFSDIEWEEKKNTTEFKRTTPSLTMTFPELAFAMLLPCFLSCYVLLMCINVFSTLIRDCFILICISIMFMLFSFPFLCLIVCMYSFLFFHFVSSSLLLLLFNVFFLSVTFLAVYYTVNLKSLLHENLLTNVLYYFHYELFWQ